MSKQKFYTYKDIEKITTESAAFGTSTWPYACAYAKQYGKIASPGVIVAFQLRPGLEFFDLRNKQEYIDIGLPAELADIFVDCEPYFAINTHIPNNQKKIMPIEFSIAQDLIQNFSNIKTRNVLDLIEHDSYFPSYDQIKSDYHKIFKQLLLNVFQIFIGKNKMKNDMQDKLLHSKFNSINDFFEYSAPSLVYKKDHVEYMQKLRNFANKFKLEHNSEKKFTELMTDDNFIAAAKQHGFKIIKSKKFHKDVVQTFIATQFDFIPVDGKPTDSSKYKYKKRVPITLIPDLDNADMELQNLFHNYSLLYSNANYSPTIITNENYKKIYAYLQLFKVCHEYFNVHISNDNQFKNGIKVIQQRLDSDDSDATHIYIDFLQYTFFSMLCDESNEKTRKYVGVTCPEIRGYANIHRFSGDNIEKIIQPYGYEKTVNAQTMYYDDMTIIICKPLKNIIDFQDTFGHKIEFIDDIDYRKRLNLDKNTIEITNEEFINDFLPLIKSCTNVQDYKYVIEEMLKTK